MEEKTGNYEKFYNLDILKSIAVTLVIMIHVVSGELDLFGKGISMKNWMIANILDTLSRMCVPLFVMVSGYLLLRKDEPVGIFFKKRFIRIIPKFLIYSMIYYVFKVSFLHKPYPINENFLTLLLKGNIFYHFWYIYMILGLYLLTPWLRKVLKYAEKETFYVVILWFLCNVLNPYMQFFRLPKIPFSHFPITGFIGYYILGYYLKKYRHKLEKIPFVCIIAVYLAGFFISVLSTKYVLVTTGNRISDFFDKNSSTT